MSALATFRTNILALLNDPDSDRFSSGQVDAALRWALLQYDTARPLISTCHFDTDGNSVMELPSDFDPLRILKVELYADDIDEVREVAFTACKSDEAWFVRTTEERLAEGETLTLTYSAPNTIDDLDGAAGTTVPPEDEALLQIGAAGFALRIRAASSIESNNFNRDTAERLMQLAETYTAFFGGALKQAVQAGYAALPAPAAGTCQG